MMMNARKKEVLMRTDEHLVRHLEDLNDQIDQDGDRIKDHMVVDGLKDSVKTLRCIGEMLDEGEDSEEEGDADKSASFSRMKAPPL